jgi:hypothetical protein
MKDPLINNDEEKHLTKEDIKKEKNKIKSDKAIENLSYKDEDPFSSASFIFFFWVFPIIRVKIKCFF